RRARRLRPVARRWSRRRRMIRRPWPFRAAGMARKQGKRRRPVVLVRHGRAEDEHPAGDAAGALSAGGRREFRAHARELRRGLRIEAIATSPLVRAVQTAEILADALGLDDVVVRAELATDSAEAVEALARELGAGWALVGHNPSFAAALQH